MQEAYKIVVYGVNVWGNGMLVSLPGASSLQG